MKASQDGPQRRKIKWDYLKYFGLVTSRIPKSIERTCVIMSKPDAFESTSIDFCDWPYSSELKHSYYTS